MIKKKFRLKGEEIKLFFTKKKIEKIEKNGISILWSENNLNYPRFTVKPLDKIFKKAVERNKVKRKIYSIIEEYLKEGFKTNKDFFIIVKNKEILNKKYPELKNLLNLIKNV